MTESNVLRIVLGLVAWICVWLGVYVITSSLGMSTPWAMLMGVVAYECCTVARDFVERLV